MRAGSCRGLPVVTLVVNRTAPRIECVVDHHALLKHPMVVVCVVGREPKRDCKQSRGLGSEFRPSGVGAAYDKCKPIEGHIRDAKYLDETIEAAPLAVMRERFGAGDVVG